MITGGSISLSPVARVEDGNFTYINDETHATMWPGLELDSHNRLRCTYCMPCNFSDDTEIPPIIIMFTLATAPVYAYVIFIVVVGLSLCAICLAFNIIFRNRK